MQGFTESLGGLRGPGTSWAFWGGPRNVPELSPCRKQEATVPSPKTALETLDAGEWMPGSETREREALSSYRCGPSGTGRGPAPGTHAPRRPVHSASHMPPLQTRAGPLTRGRGAHTRPAVGPLGGKALLPSSPEQREAGPCTPHRHQQVSQARGEQSSVVLPL